MSGRGRVDRGSLSLNVILFYWKRIEQGPIQEGGGEVMGVKTLQDFENLRKLQVCQHNNALYIHIYQNF